MPVLRRSPLPPSQLPQNFVRLPNSLLTPFLHTWDGWALYSHIASLESGVLMGTSHLIKKLILRRDYSIQGSRNTTEIAISSDSAGQLAREDLAP